LIGEVLVGAADDAVVVAPGVVAAVVAVLDAFLLELHAATRHMAAIPANATFGLNNLITSYPLCCTLLVERRRA